MTWPGDLPISRAFGAAAATWDGVIATVGLTGKLDVISVPALTELLTKVAEAQPGRLVLDLGGLEFVDIAGGRALARAQGPRSRVPGHRPLAPAFRAQGDPARRLHGRLARLRSP